MRDLRLKLDNLQFDELAEIARSQIPSLAPRWTDHNVHDPGIMLTELMAWIADAQIYSLGRNRRDERRAYARLMGIEPVGPSAAEGHLWPDRALAFDPARPVSWARGTVVDAHNVCSVTHSDAPAFRSSTSLYLTTCKLSRLLARAEDGTETELTRVNEHGAAEFMPFGAAPGRHARLRLEFSGGANNSTAPAMRRAQLAIGFEIADAQISSPAQRASRLRARLLDAQGSYDLTIAADHTGMFTRTGVLLLAIDPQVMAVDDKFALEIDSPGGRWLVTPRVTRISANVIPLRQSEHLEWIDVGLGQGVPDQELKLPVPGLQFGRSHRIAVRAFDGGTWHDWKVVEDFEKSGPADRHFHLDVDHAALRFGNSLNGRVLENGAQVQATYDVSQGLKGNLAANMVWTVSGIVGVFGSNTVPMYGGKDARLDRDLQIAARDVLEESRPIVSSEDLEAAALSCTDLRVSRAHELPAPTGSRRRVSGERRLLVLADHRDDVAPDAYEPEAWLQEIHSRLAPRLPAGQRLVVVRPRYIEISLRARLVALPRLDVADLATQISKHVAENRFALLPSSGVAAWPLGTAVTKIKVCAWLRKFAGIARVLDLDLLADGQPVESEAVIQGAGLPLLRLSPGDIRVLRPDDAEAR